MLWLRNISKKVYSTEKSIRMIKVNAQLLFIFKNLLGVIFGMTILNFKQKLINIIKSIYQTLNNLYSFIVFLIIANF